MADTLLRDKNGKEELWYSEDYFNKYVNKSNEYVREQIERAFNAGLNRGMRVEFHGMYDTNKPFDETYLNEHIKQFYNMLDKQYKESFENDEVWVIGSHRKQRNYEQ